MAAAYATTAELEAWLGEAAPDNAAWLLDRATELIDSIVTTAFSLDETTELPSDSDYADALRDAICAQVRFWVEVGYEHDIDGLAGTQVSVGGLSAVRPSAYAPQAVRILKTAGLL